MRLNGGFMGLRGLAAALPLAGLLSAAAIAPAVAAGPFANFSRGVDRDRRHLHDGRLAREDQVPRQLLGRPERGRS